MTKIKTRARDLKKQRWAAIVATVLALVMIGSLVGGYLLQSAGSRSTTSLDQQHYAQPDDYLAYYQGEVERLEKHLETFEPTPEILLELAYNYRHLLVVLESFFDDSEVFQDYQSRLASIYQSLIEHDPKNVKYRLELAYLYIEQRDSEDLLHGQVAALQDLLIDEPDPSAHFSLIELLLLAGEKDLYRKEAELLCTYLEEKVYAEKASPEEYFYYALVQGEFLGDRAAAEAVLLEILGKEIENGIHREARSYLDYLYEKEASGNPTVE